MADAYICRRGGSGGIGGSELIIVCGTTSPAKANHNTVWIDTANDITSCVLSASEPETPVEGMVCITLSNFGNIRVVSPVGGDWITIYPMAAKQYVGGSWVDVSAKSYQDGTWVEWMANIVIYNSGVKGVKLTLVNVTESASSLNMTIPTNGEATITSDPISLNGQTVLTVEYSNLQGSGTFAGGIQVKVQDESGTVVATTNRTTDTSGKLTLDISALTGKHVVVVYANNTSGSYAGSCVVSKIEVVT